MSVENELSSMDSKQATKRDELVKCETELKESKERVGEAEAEMKSLSDKEAMLAKKSTELLVRCAFIDMLIVSNRALSFF